MKSKIAIAISILIIVFCSYKVGHNQSIVQLLSKTEICADKTQKENYIGDYYAHEGPTNPRGYYSHAEAYTEMIFAKCIRQELYR